MVYSRCLRDTEPGPEKMVLKIHGDQDPIVSLLCWSSSLYLSQFRSHAVWISRINCVLTL